MDVASPALHWVLWAVAAVALVAAGLWLWLRGVAHYYRLTAEPPRHFTVRTDDGWTLSLFHRPAPKRRFLEPVLLCHGLMANRYFFDFDPPHSVAHHLAAAGFEVFTVELRGTGASARPPAGARRTYCVDDHIRSDAPALIQAALERTGARRAFWLGHSLGALVGYGAAQGPSRDTLAGLLALGAPVSFQYGALFRAGARWGGLATWPRGLGWDWVNRGVSPFVGWVALPYTSLVINPRNMPARLQRQVLVHAVTSARRALLLQLRDWALNDAFRSLDRTVDYRAGLTSLTLPLLVMAGSQDGLASPHAAQLQYSLAGSADKRLVVFGTKNGDAQEYGHGDLVFGTRAPQEVYPVFTRWLEAHATPVESASPEQPLHTTS